MNALSQQRQPFFFVVDFLGTQFEILPLHELASHAIEVDFTGKPSSMPGLTLQPTFNSIASYTKQFEQVMREIHYGNTYLCNLTTATAVQTEQDLREIYKAANAKYKILFKNQWVCFSPETFVKIDHRGISSNPMKGTINANIPDAERALLNDPKEIAEHYTIVDLIRNDLSIVAKKVTVQKFRYLSKVQTAKGDLLQTSSKIVGELETDYLDKIGSIFCALLPAGSISGAPKKKTMEIIRATETYDRGFYTGVAGIFDGTKLDSCVLIRFIEKTTTGMVYKSGGGITKYSDLQKEYQEVKQKIYVPTA